ncbi:MAG TPA: hypothetical protein VH852_07195 [Hyphomicrobium sp.]|jgi:hypothetical protein
MRALYGAAMILVLGMLAAAVPSLSGEAKLATDEAVREGMIAIRDLVRLNHSLITHRRMPPDHAQRFAKAIKAQADVILATSKVSGEAKQRLAALLNEVVAGVDAVAHPERGVAPMDGLVRVDEALAQYPQAFDHPGWAPVQSLE